jgi:hypothetical protein
MEYKITDLTFSTDTETQNDLYELLQRSGEQLWIGNVQNSILGSINCSGAFRAQYDGNSTIYEFHERLKKLL